MAKPPARGFVRFGSKADICSAPTHVRFTPDSGHVQRTSSCLLWANSGHRALHSITLSARVSSCGGTVRPSALAVLRSAQVHVVLTVARISMNQFTAG